MYNAHEFSLQKPFYCCRFPCGNDKPTGMTSQQWAGYGNKRELTDGALLKLRLRDWQLRRPSYQILCEPKNVHFIVLLPNQGKSFCFKAVTNKLQAKLAALKPHAMKHHSYWVYIIANSRKSTLYIGVTNNIVRRLVEHYQNRGKPETFAGRYHCYYLVWYEWHQYIPAAIAREKALKHFTRQQKELLITEMNPKWRFLNIELCGVWPPDEALLESLGKED